MTEAELRRELAKLRKENKLLKDLIKKTATEKQYEAYLKGIKKAPKKKSTFEEKFDREAKKLKIKTKLVKLMREYNKIVQASKTKVKYPKITIKSLQKQGFKPTAKNLKTLEAQIQDTINKQEENQQYPPAFLMSMFEGIVFNMIKSGFDANLCNIATNIRDNGSFDAAVNKITYNSEIFQILELLYDTVAAGEEDETRQLLIELMNIVDQAIRS